MSIRGTLAVGLIIAYSLILMSTNGAAADWAWIILAAAAAVLFVGRSRKEVEEG